MSPPRGADDAVLTDLVAGLVAIESVNPKLVDGGSGEEEVAAEVARWMDGGGLEVSVEEGAPGRPNVVGHVRGSGGGPTLLLAGHTDTFRVDADAEIVQLLARHSGADIVPQPYWTDAALLAAAGVPAVLFGPAGGGAHADDEWVDLASVARVRDVLVAVAEEFCGIG